MIRRIRSRLESGGGRHEAPDGLRIADPGHAWFRSVLDDGSVQYSAVTLADLVGASNG